MQKQAPSGERQMSTLRKCLRKPHPWLALVLVAAITCDGLRAPSRQISARVYVALVRGYQRVVRPYLRGYVCCRYRPSCSEYSIEAVQRHGIAKGLQLTVCRLCRCTRSVPVGTDDPLPDGCGGSRGPGRSAAYESARRKTMNGNCFWALPGFRWGEGTGRGRRNESKWQS